ncbi:short-chain dehydrogenase [Actinomycetospora sp. NBRC 106375]|uniref:SDR family oxidoreductase n=1 Tax=Actinomycetospora sp. NBRC 106375 TaxID=3032207 RepID=UPI0024A42A5F|nr:SDR family oxidoreductase [Actinomycetospora sp. NBRC 106375]GLZ45408.1 short-chain dehydrogenase [Actinomycetospora sp. NBRC 106375]
MIISGANALVTGASRGLGAALVEGLLAHGAGTVYAAARDPRTATHKDPRVVPLRLDVTDLRQVHEVAERAGDVDLLINNAGVSGAGSLLTADPERARAEMETNLWGPVAMLRAFAPVLARNGGGAAVTVLSALSWAAMPGAGAYSATKAAAWSFTNTARAELRDQGTQVVGVHLGFMDTEMVAHLDVPKIDAATVAERILDAVAAGEEEVLADAPSRAIKEALAGPPKGLEI